MKKIVLTLQLKLIKTEKDSYLGLKRRTRENPPERGEKSRIYAGDNARSDAFERGEEIRIDLRISEGSSAPADPIVGAPRTGEGEDGARRGVGEGMEDKRRSD